MTTACGKNIPEPVLLKNVLKDPSRQCGVWYPRLVGAYYSRIIHYSFNYGLFFCYSRNNFCKPKHKLSTESVFARKHICYQLKYWSDGTVVYCRHSFALVFLWCCLGHVCLILFMSDQNSFMTNQIWLWSAIWTILYNSYFQVWMPTAVLRKMELKYLKLLKASLGNNPVILSWWST